MSDSAAKPRPQFRNIHVTQILRYRLPWAGKVSILHRVSGAALFLALPFLLLLLDRSLTSEFSFADYQAIVSQPWVKLILLGLIWAYLHHFCAGIRYLVLDLHMGIDKGSANTSALVVLVVSLLLTALVAYKLFVGV
jgi:succinate dehydrogenase / fumarate reductase cytochrome b subunit